MSASRVLIDRHGRKRVVTYLPIMVTTDKEARHPPAIMVSQLSNFVFLANSTFLKLTSKITEDPPLQVRTTKYVL